MKQVYSEAELKSLGEKNAANYSLQMKGTANCKLCKQTPLPEYYGSPRRCGFDSNGIFTPDNWCCETLNRLRSFASEIADECMTVRRDDQSYAALWVPGHPEDVPDGEEVGPWRGGGFIAMTWYKSRGTVEVAVRVDSRNGGTYEAAGLPLTMSEAEAAVENLTLAREKQ